MQSADQQFVKSIRNLFKTMIYLESPEGQRSLAQQEREDEAARQEALNRQNADLEFREEVIDAMVDAGISRRVAANMTANEKTLMDNARKYGVI
jgi:hypothetical protein